MKAAHTKDHVADLIVGGDDDEAPTALAAAALAASRFE